MTLEEARQEGKREEVARINSIFAANNDIFKCWDARRDILIRLASETDLSSDEIAIVIENIALRRRPQ